MECNIESLKQILFRDNKQSDFLISAQKIESKCFRMNQILFQEW